ncbi:hypothetical protein [Kitasatospora sp. NPDC057223]|uniref:hypothetical protein n=1 Tax=Kitasatospora sp. NPDC057223 TaxID=3346055 RepID=UPI0036325A29
MAKTPKPGDPVRITNLYSDDGSCAKYVGQTGTVSSIGGNNIAIRFAGDPDRSYGFFTDEMEPA